MLKEIKNLNVKKLPQQNDVSVKVLKLTSEICFYYVAEILNKYCEKAIFPDALKFFKPG